MRKKNRKSLVGLQAGFMSLGTFLSRILGFLRDICIATFFSKTETDIFFVAFRFPNFFRRLFGEGSFSASVTPALTESLYAQEGKKLTKELYSCLFTILFCVTSVLTLLAVFFMKDIMELFFANSAYAQIEGKLEKTILVGQLVFAYLFFVSLYSYFLSVAQVFGRFFLPALAPAFFNLSLILFAFTPQSWWPFPSFSLGLAVIIGGIFQIIPVLYEMYRLDFFPKFVFRFKKVLLLKVGKRFLPGMLGLSGLSLIGLINVYFVAWLEEGAPSYIYYGDRLMEFPRALIAVSVGTALIPELTRLYSLDKLSDFKEMVNYYLRFLLFLILPCALVCLFLAQPIVELLFSRGQFDSESILKTSMVLQIYSVVLIFSSLSRILSSCFFAINKNWHIVICTGFFVCFHALFAWFLTPVYGLKGLVGATALSSIVYFLLVISFLVYLIGGLDFKKLFLFLTKNLISLCLLVLCLLSYPFVFSFSSLFAPHSITLFLSLGFVFCLSGGLYVFSGIFLREPIARDFLNLGIQFFKKKKSKKYEIKNY